MRNFLEKHEKLLLSVSLAGIVGCILLLITHSAIVDLIANSWLHTFVERYIENRALTAAFWSNRLLRWGKFALFLFSVLPILFLGKHLFTCSDNAGKKWIFISMTAIIGCFLLMIMRAAIADWLANSAINTWVETYIEHRKLTVAFWSKRLIHWYTPTLLLFSAIALSLFCKHILNASDSARAAIKDLFVLRTTGLSVQPEITTPHADYNNLARRLSRYFIIAATGLFVYVILYAASWTFGDDYHFVATTAVNKYYPLLIMPSSGRFFPIAYAHHNLALLLWRCLGFDSGLPVFGNLITIAMLYVVTVVFLYKLFAIITRNYVFSALFAGLMPLSTASLVYTFMYVIFPETAVVALLAVFMFCYYRALETGKIQYYVIALLAAAYCTYCKEPVFGALLIIAGVNLLFNWRSKIGNERRFYFSLVAKQRIILRLKLFKERCFYLLLIVNGIVFMALYYYFCYQYTVTAYNVGRVRDGLAEMVFSIFNGTPILYLTFILGLIRLWGVVIKREREYLYYDSLLFAGIGYVGAIVALHLNLGYYFLPAVILSLPALVFWIQHWYARRKIYALGLLLPLVIIGIGNYSDGIRHIKWTWQARQEFMPCIENLAQQLNAGKTFIWYESDRKYVDNDRPSNPVRRWWYRIENRFLNYANRTTDVRYFAVTRQNEKAKEKFVGKTRDGRRIPPLMKDWDENYYFFYPACNDQWPPMTAALAQMLTITGSAHRDYATPMPAALAQMLADNHFSLYSDLNGVLIYQREKTE